MLLPAAERCMCLQSSRVGGLQFLLQPADGVCLLRDLAQQCAAQEWHDALTEVGLNLACLPGAGLDPTSPSAGLW